MRVRFWGTRGSIPTPGSSTAIYGGNTSCVEVRADDGTVIIFDCGTGIRDLGIHLLQSKKGLLRVYLLIGHTHWDHIQGFPFFPLLFLPDVELNIYAPAGFQRSLQDAIAGQMQYSYFPIKLQDLSSRLYYTELGEGFFRLGELLIETRYLNHTAPTIAYRLNDGTTTIAYVTDHEPFWNVPGPVFLHPGDRQHVEFLRDTDLIIHDAQYTSQQYETRRGWGHSSIEYATDVAVAARAGKLALFHHDPAHTDAILKQIEDGAQQRAASFGSDTEVFCAAEGRELEIIGKRRVFVEHGASALEVRPDPHGRILVLSGNRADATDVRLSLLEENCIITSTSDMRSALAIVEHSCPDIVIMNAAIGGDIASQIEALREHSGNLELPVLLLTDLDEDNERMVIVQGIATDYIAKPFSRPMLRSRVRAWRARAGAVPAAVSDSAAAKTALKIDKFLASSSIFGSLTQAELLQLMGSGTEHSYAVGEAIVRQGDQSDSAYVILSGRVRVEERAADTDIELVLGEFGAGEVFGELGTLRNEPRSATVTAVEETKCLRIPQHDFIFALENSSQFALALMQILSDRLYETDKLLARNAPDSVTGLPSRRAFGEIYHRLASSARRRKSSVLLLTIDLVQLKEINDYYGYAAGDTVLRTIADALLAFVAENGLAARYGGDEFAAILLDVKQGRADELIAQFRSTLQHMLVRKALPVVDCSIGYVWSETPPEAVEPLLREADRVMRSKRLRLIGRAAQ